MIHGGSEKQLKTEILNKPKYRCTATEASSGIQPSFILINKPNYKYSAEESNSSRRINHQHTNLTYIHHINQIYSSILAKYFRANAIQTFHRTLDEYGPFKTFKQDKLIADITSSLFQRKKITKYIINFSNTL